MIQEGDEVKRALKHPGERRWIKARLFGPEGRGQLETGEDFAPAFRGPIVVGEGHAVAGIADPVHKAQGGSGKHALQQVVFDEKMLARDAGRFPQQSLLFRRMMDHVHQKNHVKRAGREGQIHAVELPHRNMGLPANEHVNAFDAHIGAEIGDCAGEQAVATAHIEHRGPVREQFGHKIGQDPDPPVMDVSFVKSIQAGHEAHLFHSEGGNCQLFFHWSQESRLFMAGGWLFGRQSGRGKVECAMPVASLSRSVRGASVSPWNVGPGPLHAQPVPDLDQVVTIHGVPWETYLALDEKIARRTVRLTYLRGTLQIMTISRLHEILKTNIHIMIAIFCDYFKIDIYPEGSATRTVENLCAGEADESYCVGEEKPVPDFVLEVALSGGGLDKLYFYRELGVPEVWVWREGGLEIWQLNEGEYGRVDQSRFLPELKLDVLVELATTKPLTKLLREFRQRQFGL